VADEEKRRNPRRPLRVLAMVQTTRHGTFKVETIDISLGGLCVHSPNQMAGGEACVVYFSIPVSGVRRDIRAVAKVAYSTCSGLDGFKVGLEFKEIDKTSTGAIVWYTSQ